MSKFCGLVCQRKPNENYEYISYFEMQDTQAAQAPTDRLDRFVPATKQSRTRLPIYFKSTPNKNRSVTFNIADKSNIELCKRSPNISKFPYLMQTPQVSTKLTSTLLDAYKTQATNTPNTSNIPYKLFESTRNETKCETFYSCDDTESTPSTNQTSDSTTTDESEQNQNELCDYRKCYVCYQDFDGKYEGDLPSKFSDRFQILQDNGTDYVFVRNLASKKCGYIPRQCITTVDIFLSNLV
jgi:hypothetical protein